MKTTVGLRCCIGAILFLLLFCSYLSARDVDEIDIADIYDQSVYLFEQNKWEEAIEGFEQVMGVNPEYEEASKYLDKSKKKSSKFHYRLGINLYRQGKLEDAIEEFKKSIKFNAKYRKARVWLSNSEKKIAKFYYEQGDGFYKEGKWENAISNLGLAVKYGNYNVQRQEWILRRISNAKNDINVELCDKGLKFYNEDDFLKAEEYFNMVLSYDKAHVEAKKYLGEIGDKKTGMVKEYYFQGLREYDQGNIKKAIQLWEEVLKYDPGHMNVQTSLERAREEIKKE